MNAGPASVADGIAESRAHAAALTVVTPAVAPVQAEVAPVTEVEGAPVDPGPAVRALFGAIGPGTRVGSCTVVAVHRPVFGGIPVVLATADGEPFQVDVFRRDAGEVGVGNSPSLSVFVVNDGDGSTSTREAHGLGAMALGRALAQRESDNAAVPSLLTRAERASRYPGGTFRVA